MIRLYAWRATRSSIISIARSVVATGCSFDVHPRQRIGRKTSASGTLAVIASLTPASRAALAPRPWKTTTRVVGVDEDRDTLSMLRRVASPAHPYLLWHGCRRDADALPIIKGALLERVLDNQSPANSAQELTRGRSEGPP